MNVDKILTELYVIEPDLRANDKENRELIERMLANKPKIKYNINFEQNLRREILQHAEENQKQKSKFLNLNFNFMNKVSYTVAGLAVVAIASVTTVHYMQNNNDDSLGKNPQLASTNVSFENNVTKGNFDLNFDNGSGGGEEDGSAVAVADMASGGGMVMEKSMSMIMPRSYGNYNYEYVGGDVNMEKTELPVLKAEPIESDIFISQIKDNLNFAGINLDAFKDLKINNISLSEDVEKDGYNLNLNLVDGTINISYSDWGDIDYDDFKIKLKDSSESDIVKVANDFVNKYSISTESYGYPRVQGGFDNILRRSYSPNSVSVIYPILIDGMEIVNNNGNANGMTVEVNLNMGKVTNLNTYDAQKYVSQDYPAVNDFDSIKKYIDGLGTDDSFSFEFEDKTEDKNTIKLSTPTEVWMMYYSYSGNSSSQYLIPALSFEMTYPEDSNNAYQNALVVPLNKEMFDKLLPEDERVIEPMYDMMK